MTTSTLIPIEEAIPESGLVLRDVSWEEYEQFLEDIGDRRMPHSYNDGELRLMAPSARHESPKEWITRLIGALAEELGYPLRSIGSTTLKSAFEKKGAEPDAGFLIANEPAVRGKRDWDPQADPPPDLLVEIDVTSSSLERLPVYAAVGVAEVWIYDGRQLFIQVLRNDHYEQSETSASFPALPIAEFTEWIEKAWQTDESTWIRGFREWVRENIGRS